MQQKPRKWQKQQWHNRAGPLSNRKDGQNRHLIQKWHFLGGWLSKLVKMLCL